MNTKHIAVTAVVVIAVAAIGIYVVTGNGGDNENIQGPYYQITA